MRTVRETVSANLLSTARVIGANSAVTLQFDDADAASDVLAALSSEEHIIGAALLTKDHEIFVSFGSIVFDTTALVSKALEFSEMQLGNAVKISAEFIETFEMIRTTDGEHIGMLYLRSDLSVLSKVIQNSL
ncbi:MAG: CHASE sensor domain-containing protein, partial [bacterium]